MLKKYFRLTYKSSLVFALVLGTLILGAFLRINFVQNSRINMDLWHDSHAYFTYAHTLQEYGIYSHYNDQNNGEFQYSGLFEDSQDKNPRKWRLRVSDTPPPPDNFISPGYPLFISIFLSGIQKNIDYQSVMTLPP